MTMQSPATTAQPEVAYSGETRLALSGVTKSFPGVTALDNVSFDCRPGEVHALVGENGSGKSTLIKVAAGVLKPDEGSVQIGGVQLRAANPLEACRLGLSTAYQDTSLVNELTVAQNIELSFQALDQEPPKDIPELLAELDLPFGPGVPVKSLGPGGRQMLEVVRALVHRPQVLILDEPTAALDMRTAAQLQEWILQARDEGLAIVYVSHRLEEVRRLANRLTVIRDGVIRGTYARMDWEVEEIVELMVGTKVGLEFPARAPVPADAPARLAVTELVADGVGPVSLEVRGSEIVGIAGAEGNGQRKLLRALVGLNRADGEILVDGRRSRVTSPGAALSAGLMFQSGDRAAESVFPSLSALDNATFQLGSDAGPGGLALRGRLIGRFKAAVGKLGIVAASPYQPISALSGGNQQKIVLARPALAAPKVLVVDEPTQGVDAKARLEIYRTLAESAEAGVGVLVNSSDSAELAGLCDRIYVMSDGVVVDELQGGDITESDIVRRFVATTQKIETTRTETARAVRKIATLAASPQVPVVILAAIIVAVAAYTQGQNASFLSSGNIANMAIVCMPLLSAVLGQQFVLIAGGFDISIGASMTLSVVMTSFLLTTLDAGSLLATLAVALAIGVAIGLFNALLVLGFKINAVIATIGTLGIVSGVSIFLRPEPGGVVAPQLSINLMEGIGAVPYCLIVALVIAVVLDVWLMRGHGGLAARAAGLDAESSRRIGVRVDRVRTIGFVVAAVGAVGGGIFLASQVGMGSNDVGLSFALPTFAACFLGGASLAGGRGTFLGASLGVVLLTMIGNAGLLLGYTDAVSQIIYGVILLVAVTSYALAARKAAA